MLSIIRKMSTPSRIPNLETNSYAKEIFDKYKDNHKKYKKKSSYINMYSGLI